MVNREMEPDRGNPVNRFMHMNATRARASTIASITHSPIPHCTFIFFLLLTPGLW